MAEGATVNIDVLIIGGSAGSLEVLLSVLPDLHEDLAIAIVIILHRKRGHDHLLTDLLSVKTRIPVQEIEEKQPVLPANIYLSPADYHILFEKNQTFSLDFSEKVNFSRPSIDVAFNSAAHVFKDRLTALLLSGANADGVRGLAAVKKNGGKILIQDPDTASVPFMPAQALSLVDKQDILPVDQMAAYINRLPIKTKKP